MTDNTTPEDTVEYPSRWLQPHGVRAEEPRPEILDRLKTARPGATPTDYQDEPAYPAHWTQPKG